jgi:hypothetical protein
MTPQLDFLAKSFKWIDVQSVHGAFLFKCLDGVACWLVLVE